MYSGNATNPAVFLGNYNNGIRVIHTNYTDPAVDPNDRVTGKLAAKCLAVSPRAVYYQQNGDASLLYKPMDADFLAYVEDLYGFRPLALAPSQITLDSLNLLRDVMRDDELIRYLREEGRARNWRLSPFIMHRDVHRLGRMTGLPVMGTDQDKVEAGLTAQLNSKAQFQKICREIGLPVAESEHVIGRDALVASVRRAFDRYKGHVMLRQASGASGMGNQQITPKAMAELGITDIDSFLEATILAPTAHSAWVDDVVLVEPYLDERCSPAILCYIGDQGDVQFVTDSLQIFEEGDERRSFIGTQIPSPLDPHLAARIRNFTLAYVRHVARMGARGHINIDWMVLMDGNVIACESNYRYTGVVHPFLIRRRLANSHEHRFLLRSDDALHYHGNLSFGQVLTFMDRHDLRWNADRGDGVVVTIPPAEGSMGFLALGTSVERVEELYRQMLELGNHA